MKLAILAASAVGALAAAPQPPVWPAQYISSGTVSLPLGNLTEPFTVYTDNKFGQQRIEWYGGLDTYVYVAPMNQTWQVNPQVHQMQCVGTVGPITIANVLPSLQGFSYNGTTTLDTGMLVQDWTYTTNNMGYVGHYHMYVSLDGAPVRYYFIGRDFLLGSHSDEYIFDYNTFITADQVPAGTALFPNGTFAQPAPTCGSFPGAPVGPSSTGQSLEDGQGLFLELVPQNGAAPSGPPHPKADRAFGEFVERYGRSYSSPAEWASRHATFTKNRRTIGLRNRKARAMGKSLRLAMNVFGDATPEEMAPRHGRRADGAPSPRKAYYSQPGASNGAHAVHPAPASKASLPASVDWIAAGAVTPVRDQGICGSCWAHGASQMLEGQRAIKKGILAYMSPQEACDCSWGYAASPGSNGNAACDGGEDFGYYQWVMAVGGASDQATYGPYLAQDGFCHSTNADNTARLPSVPAAVQITSYVNVTSGSEPALMDALANVGPVSVSMYTMVDSFVFYTSGVFEDPACQNGVADLDHTILATGYGTWTDGTDYYMVKNSWSDLWGDNGYIRVARAGNMCGIETTPTYALIA